MMFFKFNPLSVLLTFLIIYQSQDQQEENGIWHDPWTFFTINLRNKSLHNSIDLSGFYLQVYILPWLGKILFAVLRLLYL